MVFSLFFFFHTYAVYSKDFKVCAADGLLWAQDEEAFPKLKDSQQATSGLKVLESGAGGMVVEFSSPQLRIENREEGGIVYQVLSMAEAGLTQDEGKPRLPLLGFLIAIPPLAEAELVVLEQEAKVLDSSLLIYPAPRRIVVAENENISIAEEFTLDRACYSQDQWIPEHPFRIDPAQYLRHQKVARLTIFPVQYNPALRKVRLWRRAKIKVIFREASLRRKLGGGEEDGRRGEVGLSFDSSKGLPATFSTGKMSENQNIHEVERLLENVLINYSLVKEHPELFTLSPSPSLESSSLESKARRRMRLSGSVGLHPLKIAIEQEGLYRILGADLKAAGWDLNLIVPRKLALYHQGREIPISIVGAEDGYLSAGDRIIFWGTAINSRFTKKNIYWLEQKETGEGMRIGEQEKGGAHSGEGVNYFIDHLHLEENNIYWQTLPGGMDKDRWFWRQMTAPSAADFPFSIYSLSSGEKTATVRILFQGKTDIATTKPDHHLIITLNGSVIGDFSWDGQSEYLGQIQVSSTLLQEGNNTLTIKAVGDTGASIDTVLVNWIELDYPRMFVAQNHKLLFPIQGEGRYEFHVRGFSDREISVFDITDPERIMKIGNISIEAEAASVYGVSFSAAVSGRKRYAVLGISAEQSPLSIESGALVRSDREVDLRSTDNAADYLIITHPDFWDSILPLADYRKAQGWRVRVVDIYDIYDEFSYGIADPQAIQDFLRYCFQNWAPPAPLFVLLVGDANMDYLDNYKTGRADYLPTHLYFTADIGETPNDNWFVCVSGEDILPDMFLGRMPARNPSEVRSIVEKIISYEQQNNQPWHQRALLVAGKDDPQFQTITDELARDFGLANFEVQKVYAASYPNVDLAAEQIRRKLSDGHLITVYCGHGNVDKWESTLFQLSDVQRLENIGRPSFIILLTCLNGFFPHPKQDCCLAEELLRAENKGAVACWAPVSVSYPTEQKNLTRELLNQIFRQGNNILGVCTTLARINTYVRHQISGDMAQNYLLFGDPATRLKGEYGASAEARIIIKPGINFFSLPGRVLPSLGAEDLLVKLSSQGIGVRKISGYDSIDKKWQTGVWKGGALKGIDFDIVPGQGYVLYADGDSERTLSFVSSCIIPFYSSYILDAGYNLLGFPAPLGDYTSYDLHRELGADSVFSVATYGKRSGKWQESYSFFSLTAGERYQIEPGCGYGIGIAKARRNWSPGPWSKEGR